MENASQAADESNNNSKGELMIRIFKAESLIKCIDECFKNGCYPANSQIVDAAKDQKILQPGVYDTCTLSTVNRTSESTTILTYRTTTFSELMNIEEVYDKINANKETGGLIAVIVSDPKHEELLAAFNDDKLTKAYNNIINKGHVIVSRKDINTECKLVGVSLKDANNKDTSDILYFLKQ